MAKTKTPKGIEFKPYIGRLFYLKHYSNMGKYWDRDYKLYIEIWRKDFNDVVMVLDESSKEVLVLNKNQRPTWIKKHFLKSETPRTTLYQELDVINNSVSLLTEVRNYLTALQEGTTPKSDYLDSLIKKCWQSSTELRSIEEKVLELKKNKVAG